MAKAEQKRDTKDGDFPCWLTLSAGYPIEFRQIKRTLRKGGIATYRYVLVPVRANPNLERGDEVEMLWQIYGGFTIYVRGRIFGKYTNHYQIYIPREVERVIRYVIENNLPIALLAIQKRR
jgi:hypothetical protein